MSRSIQIKGTEALIRRIDKLNDKTKVQQVVRNNSFEFERRARAKAPVDTGFLRRNIQAKVGKLEGKITSNANYSGYLEYGTRYMRAQPFMKPTYDEIKKQFQQQLKKAVEDSR